MELPSYFPDLDDNKAKIVGNTFSGNICMENLPETMQDEFLELQNYLFAEDAFEEMSLNEFGIGISCY